jgi:hypothetical protein
MQGVGEGNRNELAMANAEVGDVERDRLINVFGEMFRMELHISKLDPFLCDFEMPLKTVFYPLGFSLEIATNSAGVLEAAAESWGHFRKVFSGPTLRLRIAVEGESDGCPPDLVCRQQHNLLARVADARNFAVSDVQHGFAFAWLTRTAVEHRAYLRSRFLESIVWDLLEPSCVTPVHAACVERGEHGFLFCGDSGAGKSTLAYACARNGWTYLSDDYCHVVRGRNDRMLIGNPHQIRLRESTIAIFPELMRYPCTPHEGEMIIELATPGMPEIKTALFSPIDYIIFLKRGPYAAPQLTPFPKHGLLEWFEQILWGPKEIRDVHKNTLRSLLTAEIFELRYSDLRSAVDLLETMVPYDIGALCDWEPAQERAG